MIQEKWQNGDLIFPQVSMGGARKVNNQTKCSNDSVFKMSEIHAFGNVLNHFQLAMRTGEETMKIDDEE